MIYLLGMGGHAGVLLDACRSNKISIDGILSADINNRSEFQGIEVLGDDSYVSNLSIREDILVNGLGSIPVSSQQRRIGVARNMRSLGLKFLSVLHKNAIIGDEVVIGEGVQVMAGAIVQFRSQLGQDAIINTAAVVDHDCVIGDYCHVAPGVTICGCVTIGNRSHIGPGAVIRNGISIGDDVIVGSGVVISEDIKSGTVLKNKTQYHSEKFEK